MIRILIVDDDDSIRQVVRLILEDAGYIIYGEAEDGRKALTKLRASQHPLVVVTDDIMPTMSGLKMLEIVAADPVLSTRHTYIMATPGSIKDAPVLRELHVPCLPMPFDMDDLLAVVKQAATRLPSEN
ncbi:MAG: hypothetical protein OJF49_003157 [Ktedonobacterales bacterium]|nr:MAG: hypothetical protein OJF49_003157 [Ktedonobacterales bacterium]